MAERIRFNAARQVLEGFPDAADEIGAAPGDEPPIDFLRRLIAEPRRFDAITYAAFLLPRRESVWWGCRCVRALAPAFGADGLAAAEAWVRSPEDAQRRAALTIGESARRRAAGDWLALAAGHSGGNVAPDGLPHQAALPHMTAVGVKCAVILALARKAAREQPPWTTACAEAALRFAEGGDVHIVAPALPPDAK